MMAPCALPPDADSICFDHACNSGKAIKVATAWSLLSEPLRAGVACAAAWAATEACIASANTAAMGAGRSCGSACLFQYR